MRSSLPVKNSMAGTGDRGGANLLQEGDPPEGNRCRADLPCITLDLDLMNPKPDKPEGFKAESSKQ